MVEYAIRVQNPDFKTDEEARKFGLRGGRTAGYSWPIVATQETIGGLFIMHPMVEENILSFSAWEQFLSNRTDGQIIVNRGMSDMPISIFLERVRQSKRIHAGEIRKLLKDPTLFRRRRVILDQAGYPFFAED